ncbi:MAG: 50S ribosomal protein L9 [Elusimicrobiota bacterium]
MSQSVVLLTDVPGLGQLGDTCKVKDGYARNYLIPRKKALIATSNIIKRFENQKKKLEVEKQKQLEKSKELASKVANVGLVFERPVGQGGRLFGSVTPLDIALELAKHGTSVEKKSILMNGPIKVVGDHQIRVRVHSQVILDIPVKIVGLEAKKDSEHQLDPKMELDEQTPLQKAPPTYM